jgi:hypothetical protein
MSKPKNLLYYVTVRTSRIKYDRPYIGLSVLALLQIKLSQKHRFQWHGNQKGLMINILTRVVRATVATKPEFSTRYTVYYETAQRIVDTVKYDPLRYRLLILAIGQNVYKAKRSTQCEQMGLDRHAKVSCVSSKHGRFGAM